MAVYILLTNLTDDGRKTIRSRPERIREVNKEIEGMGGKVIAQYATLGPYDFVNVIEAANNEVMVTDRRGDRLPRLPPDTDDPRHQAWTTSSRASGPRV